jgi:hypothetical protein
MFEYEMHQLRSTELIRQAEQERIARDVVRARRAGRSEATRRSAEPDSHTDRPRRHRFARVA